MSKPKKSAGSDRIELLRTFVRVVEAGSFSAVATQTMTTQPTVSRRLKALEEELGLQLLHRSTHTMHLTSDGERCYEQAKKLLANWEAFHFDLNEGKAEVEGVLRVVVPHAFGQDLLVDSLARFLKRHPQVSVEWLLHDDRSLHDYIAAGIDCAIQVGEVRDLGVVATKLSEVPRIAVASPQLVERVGFAETPSELAKFPWLSLHTFYRNEIELIHQTTGARERISFRPRFSTDNLYALRNAAVLGLGVCVGSSWLLDDDIAHGRLIRVASEWEAAPLPVYLIYPYARYYPARLRRFVEAMKEAMPAFIKHVEANS